jgi:hypothetical protein
MKKFNIFAVLICIGLLSNCKKDNSTSNNNSNNNNQNPTETNNDNYAVIKGDGHNNDTIKFEPLNLQAGFYSTHSFGSTPPNFTTIDNSDLLTGNSFSITNAWCSPTTGTYTLTYNQSPHTFGDAALIIHVGINVTSYMYPELNIEFTKYDNPGGYIVGTYSGTMKNVISMTSVTVDGKFKVIRVNDM